MPIILAVQVCKDTILILRVQPRNNKLQTDLRDVSLGVVGEQQRHYQQREQRVQRQKSGRWLYTRWVCPLHKSDPFSLETYRMF